MDKGFIGREQEIKLLQDIKDSDIGDEPEEMFEDILKGKIG